METCNNTTIRVGTGNASNTEDTIIYWDSIYGGDDDSIAPPYGDEETLQLQQLSSRNSIFGTFWCTDEDVLDIYHSSLSEEGNQDSALSEKRSPEQTGEEDSFLSITSRETDVPAHNDDMLKWISVYDSLLATKDREIEVMRNALALGSPQKAKQPLRPAPTSKTIAMQQRVLRSETPRTSSYSYVSSNTKSETPITKEVATANTPRIDGNQVAELIRALAMKEKQLSDLEILARKYEGLLSSQRTQIEELTKRAQEAATESERLQLRVREISILYILLKNSSSAEAESQKKAIADHESSEHHLLETVRGLQEKLAATELRLCCKEEELVAASEGAAGSERRVTDMESVLVSLRESSGLLQEEVAQRLAESELQRQLAEERICALLATAAATAATTATAPTSAPGSIAVSPSPAPAPSSTLTVTAPVPRLSKALSQTLSLSSPQARIARNRSGSVEPPLRKDLVGGGGGGASPSRYSLSSRGVGVVPNGNGSLRSATSSAATSVSLRIQELLNQRQPASLAAASGPTGGKRNATPTPRTRATLHSVSGRAY